MLKPVVPLKNLFSGFSDTHKNLNTSFYYYRNILWHYTFI